jgi:hypothetical protein
MNCPSCDSQIPLWKMRGKRPCPTCGVHLKNEFTRTGYITLALFLVAAGSIDYVLSTEVVSPLCGPSSTCTFGWGAVTALLYLVAVYLSAAAGALRYSVVSRSERANQ